MSDAETLTAIAGIARPTYRKHRATYDSCPCTTCTIARILWPHLIDQEQAAQDCQTTAVPSSPSGPRAGEPDPTEGAPS